MYVVFVAKVPSHMSTLHVDPFNKHYSSLTYYQFILHKSTL